MKNRYEKKDSFKVVGLEKETTVQASIKGTAGLDLLWKEFIKRIKEIKNKAGERIDYGVCITTGECRFKYIACVEVTDFKDIPKGMVQYEVPKSKYYVVEHKGKLDRLSETYYNLTELFRKKHIKETGIWLEQYDGRFKQDSDDSIMEIWSAIKE
jgi:AraC family transcriptional regulator